MASVDTRSASRSVLSPFSGTLAMDQPAGLQVDYIFRGVEHAVRVVVSGQVLELEVEDRMTADQWRGEFDANCEYACWVGSPPVALRSASSQS